MSAKYSDIQKTIIQVVGQSGPIDIDTLVAAMADVVRMRAMGLVGPGILQHHRGTLALSDEGDKVYRAIIEGEL